MLDQVTRIKVFVASPSDVSDERKLLQAVLEEINTSLGQRKLRFEYVGWEHVYPGIGKRPQEIINDQISPRDCDVFIGIMWSRFGTPTGEFGSGTEEEFQQAYESWQQKKSPRIFFYFCDKPPTITNKEQYEQYGKVLAFRENLNNEKGLIWTYPESVEFQRSVRRHLMLALDDLVPLQISEDPPPPVAPQRFTVFVASVRDNLKPLRAGLIEQLSSRDVEVQQPQADVDATRELMAKAHVCIHLLDAVFHPVVDQQLDASCDRAQRQILWLSPRAELSPADPDPYRQKLIALPGRSGNFEIIRSRNAAPEILERIEKLREEWLLRLGRGIFFNTHGSDKSRAQEVFDYLTDLNIEALMNDDDLGEPSKSLKEFDEKARRSRAIVVFFGAVNAAWVAARMMEVIRLVFTRGYPVEKLGVFAAPPPSKNEKVPIRLPGGIVPIWMDNTERFDPRTLDGIL